ncbi:Nuclear transcription factor Y subunit C-10 [Cardamine amara subsp. amara]|uniref:Nuclear transcription factor Y subunit C-10 n=1 Tax=Cardamine amara subsp. amara TaxID=228776 RepID=A0ABD1AJR0_CARAN
MKRPIEANSSLIPDASVKASHIRIEPVEPCSLNMLPTLDQLRPYNPVTSKVEEVSSLETALKVFWDKQRDQLYNFKGFNRKNHLPLTRVRKMLKSDPEVKMLSCDAPAFCSKVCEFFILELTLRAWIHTQSCGRQTIQRCDIFQAVKKSKIYDFLIDLVPFGPHCVTHQGPPPPPENILPDMNIPIDMNQIEQVT